MDAITKLVAEGKRQVRQEAGVPWQSETDSLQPKPFDLGFGGGSRV